MLKGKRAQKTVHQILDELNNDMKVEDKRHTEEQLVEQIRDEFDDEDDSSGASIWAEKYAQYTPEGCGGFELSRNYDRDFFEALKTHKWTDLAECHSYNFAGFDPFGTANTRDLFAEYSDLDHFKVAVSRYIQAVASQLVIDREEVQALHHVVRYWQERCTRKAVDDGEVLR